MGLGCAKDQTSFCLAKKKPRLQVSLDSDQSVLVTEILYGHSGKREQNGEGAKDERKRT